MHPARWFFALAAALGVTAMTTSPAVPAYKGCGLPGYTYAGLQSDRNGFGMTATLSALAQPLVERGHVAAWVGVGAPGEGPNGTDEWLQVGLNRIAGDQAKLYYEIADAHGVRYAEVEASVPTGRLYHVAVLEMRGRTDVWRVWVDGRAVSGPIYLPRSHGKLTPMAMAENWDGGAPACNRYKYGFRRIALAGAPGGRWARLRTTQAQVLRDAGYRILPAATGGFIALTAPPPPAAPEQQPAGTPAQPPQPAPAPPAQPAPAAPAQPVPAPEPTPVDPTVQPDGGPHRILS
jgi:hypothetical protein